MTRHLCHPCARLAVLALVVLWAQASVRAQTAPTAATAPTTGPAPAAHVPVTPFDAPEGSWTLAVLPDTQNLVQSLPEAYYRQMDWLVANRASHQIRFVVHEGDITNRNLPEQWTVARAGFQRLIDARLPFAVVCGNHDYGEMGRAADRSTLLNDYLKPSDYAASEKVGYFREGELQNTWHEFTAPTGRYLVLALEFAPRDEVLDWANQVIASKPGHRAILVTHSYLYHDSTRYDWEQFGESQSAQNRRYGLAQNGANGASNDGEAMWRKLVSRHPNVLMVLNGHVLGDGAGYLASTAQHGNTVHQILANYQASVEPRRPHRGGAFLRLMQFLPDGRTVHVRTYSPWTDEWLTDPQQQFQIDLAAPATRPK